MHSPGSDPADPRVAFVLTMARALHGYGTASHRLEEALNRVSRRLGLESQFFSTPTSIFSSFGPGLEQRTFLLRMEPGDTDLGRLARVEGVITEVLAGGIDPAEGTRRLSAIDQAPPIYGPFLTTLAFGLASGGAARFLGGGWPEIALGTGVGLVIGLLALLAGARPPLGRVFEPLAAFLASALVAAFGVYAGGVSVALATLAGLIVLMPGFTLTTAMAELATRHLSAGTSRLAGAFIIFLGIGFGVALGTRLVLNTLGAAPAVIPTPLPPWTNWGALLVAAAAFSVLLKADPRDFGWVLLSGTLALTGTRLGSAALGPELGAFVGALSVGAGSNLFARITLRPAAVPLVPGVLLLVPGSVGFRSIASLIDSQVVTGVETAFKMVLVAIALVAGLLMANIVVPERSGDTA